MSFLEGAESARALDFPVRQRRVGDVVFRRRVVDWWAGSCVGHAGGRRHCRVVAVQGGGGRDFAGVYGGGGGSG